MTIQLSDSLMLPCGVTVPNRIAKAAMTEGLATVQGEPSDDLARLYGLWSDGGAGLLLSGNIMIDGEHLERPGNVIIERDPQPQMQAALRHWSDSATRNGNQFWAQISHSGRQTQKAVNSKPKAPSSIKLGLPGGQFGQPVAMTQLDIENVIDGFARCARVVKAAGFTGVQIHAAHGYLISQFLSSRSNKRNDQYGGSLENRAALLLEVVARVRAEVGDTFPVAVKLNSADFQKGGFAFEDSIKVAKWLESAGIDLIEISGGTYEQPKLLGLEGVEEVDPQNVAESTLMREAYFVDFALAMQVQVSVPLMVTGGFRQLTVMQEALNRSAADIIGIGRPMCVDTDAPNQLFSGKTELNRYEDTVQLLPNWAGFLQKSSLIRTVANFAVQFWYYAQLLSIARTEKADKTLSAFSAVKILMKHESRWLKERRKQVR